MSNRVENQLTKEWLHRASSKLFSKTVKSVYNVTNFMIEFTNGLIIYPTSDGFFKISGGNKNNLIGSRVIGIKYVTENNWCKYGLSLTFKTQDQLLTVVAQCHHVDNDAGAICWEEDDENGIFPAILNE